MLVCYLKSLSFYVTNINPLPISNLSTSIIGCSRELTNSKWYFTPLWCFNSNVCFVILSYWCISYYKMNQHLLMKKLMWSFNYYITLNITKFRWISMLISYAYNSIVDVPVLPFVHQMELTSMAVRHMPYLQSTSAKYGTKRHKYTRECGINTLRPRQNGCHLADDIFMHFWMKMYNFRLKFHWSIFLWVQSTIFPHWCR